MNWDQIAGQWKQIKGKAKTKWGKLTDDEIDVSKVNAISSSVKSNNATESTKTRLKRKLTSGLENSNRCYMPLRLP